MRHSGRLPPPRASTGDLAAVKTFGEALIKASLPLSTAHADPALVKDMPFAETANLAIADGFMPDVAAASYNLAAKSFDKVGADCTEAGH